MTLDDLRRARSLTARTADGHDLGEIDGIWYEDGSDVVRWLKIQRGLLGVRHLTVPAEGVTAGSERVELPWTLEAVEQAPHADEGDAQALRGVAEHYQVTLDHSSGPLLFAEIEPVDEEAETQRW